MIYSQSMTLENLRLGSLGLFSVGLILVLSLLSGCSSAKQPVPVISEVALPESRPVLPNPAPIKTHAFEWVVLTEKDRIKEGEAFIALTPKDYEDLSLTMADIIRWIKEANWRLRYYKGEEMKE